MNELKLKLYSEFPTYHVNKLERVGGEVSKKF